MATTSLRDLLEKIQEFAEARRTRKFQDIELEFRGLIHQFCEEVPAVAQALAVAIQEDMTSHESPTRQCASDSSRRLPKREQEQDPPHQPSHSIEPASKKMQCTTQSRGCLDKPTPSIEGESDSLQNTTLEDEDPWCEQYSTPIFIPEGVLVGFWSADASGNGRRPVYCLVETDFEFAYLKGNTFILVRYDDFDPLDEFGDWLGDDTEDEDAMSPEEVKAWVEMMWESRVYAGLQDTTFEDTFDN
ncbi:hypothetical protein TSTA_106830 [Talaromyces stipitatus ATCC 10500]|uniref:Uncharacterized protein n=1 Tax=Talaromyces stipitatus (strain ATCC 10500 / CBS 375.48 / QM 6759 / NRRL 1006) TaxID=441959 RepID=B8MPN4_TALSN|nr:uncharacterized protein TSTA_106830 [Talaromyces stipitatus ATCC 10500]EED14473.1 hypothetical protein TSTA_106830 [Talaromyces stipitatus ATCC 10500]